MIIVLAFSASAHAAGYVYQVNANGHLIVSPNDANTSGYADLETARTFDHRARGPWEAGDTVTLDPTGPGGAVFPTGGLILPDSPAPMTFTLDGQGAILTFDVTGNRAIVNVFGSGAQLINCTLRDVGATGDGPLLDINAVSAAADITDFLVEDVLIESPPYEAGDSHFIVRVRQDAVDMYTVSGTFRRMIVNLIHAVGYSDIVGISDLPDGSVSNMDRRGTLNFIDCEVSGSDGTNVGDAANDCIGVRGTVDVWVIG
ncbi:MAG: hypothetical protein V3T70_04825, partial [Phycisphaerae bacterium]